MRALLALTAAGLVAGCSSGPSGPKTEAGTLATGDATLVSGEFADSFPVSLGQDEWVRVQLHATDFDPYVQVRPPSGTTSENDDAVEGDTQNAQIILKASQAGQYQVVVTSRVPGESGAYTLTYEVFDAEPQPVLDPQQSLAGRQAKQGTLATGDRTLRTGELFDPYPVRLRAGQRLTVRLRSTAFDPYLILKPTAGATTENDDAAPNDTQNSLIDFTAEQDGQFAIMVTTYASGESGAYTLTYEITDGSGAAPGAKPGAGAAPEAAPGSAPGSAPAAEGSESTAISI